MTCKIDRVLTQDGCVVLRVSGRIEQTHIEALWALSDREKNAKGLAIDLAEVTVVSLESVRALTVAESNGIELRNCPAYVREWISRVREGEVVERTREPKGTK